jgi:hypothetical protein
MEMKMTAVALRLLSIECIDQNERTEDEPYLNFRGRTIWDGDMKQGDTEDLSHLQPLFFNGAAEISLFEDDPNILWLDPNDHLGTVTIHDYQEPGGAINPLVFDLDGEYSLTVDIITLDEAAELIA